MPVKRIVTGVTSLDEARYFSAMGVDWIGFDAHRVDPAIASAIMGWVVGPQFFAEWNDVDADTQFAFIDTTGIDTICLPAHIETPAWFDGKRIFRVSQGTRDQSLPSNQIVLITGDGAMASDALGRICMTHVCWLEADADYDMSNLREPLPRGIAIRCETSINSMDTAYDRYDRFFDALESLDQHDT